MLVLRMTTVTIVGRFARIDLQKSTLEPLHRIGQFHLKQRSSLNPNYSIRDADVAKRKDKEKSAV